MKCRYFLLLAPLLVPLESSAAPKTPTVTVTCHAKSAGKIVAPTVCRFDGNGSSDSDANVRPFHDWRWDWNFGDAASGAHANGKSKNEDRGRRQHSAHVYWAEGTYRWSLTVTGPTGASASTNGTLTIGANNSGWSAANTVCASTSGNFAGCPAGATQKTGADFNAALSIKQRGSGMRTLFRCGETFAMNTALSGPGSFGDAAKDASFIGTFNDDGPQTSAKCTANVKSTPVAVLFDTSSMDGWRIVNLAMTNTSKGSGSNPMPFFNGSRTDTRDFLVLGGSMTAMGACVLNNAGDGSQPDRFNTFAEWSCSVDDPEGGTPEWPLGHFETEDLTLLDTTWTLTSGEMKGQRFQGGIGLYYGYSQFICPIASLGCTIHLRGSHTKGRNSERSIIADLSIFDGSLERSRNIAICASSDCAGEANNEQKNIAIENTLVRYGSKARGSLQQVFQENGTDVTIAGSIIDVRGLGARSNFRICNAISNPRVPSISARLDCLDNTVISDAAPGVLPIIVCDGNEGTDNRCRNNLIYNANATAGGSFGAGGGWTRSNNVALYGAANCPLSGSDGNCKLSPPGQKWKASEAKIRASGGGRDRVVNQGFVWPDSAPSRYEYLDFFGGCIGAKTGGPDAKPDIGAHEFGSKACGMPAAK